jgi:hypothetical protein
VGQLPLRVVQQLVPDVHQEVDAVDVGQQGVGSEMVAQEDFRLFGGGPVLTGYWLPYISWILRM